VCLSFFFPCWSKQEKGDKSEIADADLRADFERWVSLKDVDIRAVLLSHARRHVQMYEKVSDGLYFSFRFLVKISLWSKSLLRTSTDSRCKSLFPLPRVREHWLSKQSINLGLMMRQKYRIIVGSASEHESLLPILSCLVVRWKFENKKGWRVGACWECRTFMPLHGQNMAKKATVSDNILLSGIELFRYLPSIHL
jgi:hypothetical protein